MGKGQWSESSYLRWVTLFVSGSTLLCCALPIVLVSLGFGAAVASMNYNIPGMMFLAENKFWALGISALFLIFLAWVIWRPNQQCPADPKLAAYCRQANRWNKRIFWLSGGIWFIGFFFSVLLLPLRRLLDM